jgi:aminopeptidase N
MEIAKQLKTQKSKGLLKEAITTVIASSGDESMSEEMIGGFAKMPMGQEKFQHLNALGAYLVALKNTEKVKEGVDEIVKFRDGIPEQFQNQTNPFINGVILVELFKKKEEQSKADPGNTALKELAEYIKSKLPAEDKKGF